MGKKVWIQRIEEAKVRGYFSREDKSYAQSWQTCAVGEKLNLDKMTAHRSQIVINKYPRLMDRGARFAIAVGLDEIWKAEALYNHIQRND